MRTSELREEKIGYFFVVQLFGDRFHPFTMFRQIFRRIRFFIQFALDIAEGIVELPRTSDERENGQNGERYLFCFGSSFSGLAE